MQTDNGQFGEPSIEQVVNLFDNTLDQTFDKMLGNIHQHGFAVLDNALPELLTRQLLNDCITRQAEFTAAGIGRQQDRQLQPAVRNDKTLWLDGHAQAQQGFLQLMNTIRLSVNRHFYMGLFDYECHYASYQKGDFYKKHLDAFKGRSNRVFSTVCYLNTPAQGGELLLYAQGTVQDSVQVLQKISAKAGTLVVFESERFPHEVLTAVDLRYSIAGWFRTNKLMD
ncbi:MAG: SM-20-related protein [Alteromonadaceae bacterium]|jgi:SM-20-related protein